MTFEEFFQKKRINLTALQAGEPGLFAEFKIHFEQMGERSFDHTKKYWFNKLRQTYHLAPELKPEKMHLENRLAEQTIVETLTESIPAPSPKIGFKPRFNSGVANAGNDTPEALVPPASPENTEPKGEIPAETVVPKPGFKPRFNAKMVVSKPESDNDSEKPLNAESTSSTALNEIPAKAPAPKPAGFKPRFNPKMTSPKPVIADGNTPIESSAPADIETAQPINEDVEKTEEQAEQAPVKSAEATPKPAGFKPRFNMKMVVPKVDEAGKVENPTAEPVLDKTAEPVAAITDTPVEESTGDEQPPSKPAGFKPRFNAAKTKPKPPQE